MNIIIMNKTVNKFLLAGNKFMPEMHLRQPGFTYSAYIESSVSLNFFILSLFLVNGPQSNY